MLPRFSFTEIAQNQFVNSINFNYIPSTSYPIYCHLCDSNTFTVPHFGSLADYSKNNLIDEMN